jgi:hypothetical protein
VVATTKRNVENIGRTVGTMTRTIQESTRIVTDYAVQAQELNTRFAQRAFEAWIDASRRQTELSQTMVQRLYGKAEDQTDAFRGLLDDWANAYAGFFFTPLGFYREGLENVTRGVARVPVVTRIGTGSRSDGGFPIEGYDEMDVGEISGRLDGLSEEELEKVRDYEKRNKNRETLIEQLDRKIRVNS